MTLALSPNVIRIRGNSEAVARKYLARDTEVSIPAARFPGDGIRFIPCSVRLLAFMDPRLDGIARLYGQPCSGSTQRASSSHCRPPGGSVFFRIKRKMFFRATRQTLYRVPFAAHGWAYVLKINILGCRQYQAWRSPSGKQFNGIHDRGSSTRNVASCFQ